MEQSLGHIAWNAEADVARLATVMENRVPYSMQRVLATVMGNPSTDSVKEAPERGEFSPRSTPWEGIQPKIVIHPLKPLEFTPRPSYGNGEFRPEFRKTAWEGIHATFVKMPSDLAESAPPTGIHATCWNPPKIREPTRKCAQKLIDDPKPL
ncbi:hypothetical protein R3P38DRAFT_2762202 [Favolaschia claudopus]|uniref:Uncharacterized protein n=1 Tax=Favolaschia claudopus TaxID=2862362 RepID=A0AAW0DKQ5_9AGAR